jgi:enamine deaminase RidA (YjgF/YER057c/UK114 family)
MKGPEMQIEQKLRLRKIALPELGPPGRRYIHAKQIGDLLFLAGKGPINADGSVPVGKLAATPSSRV